MQTIYKELEKVILPHLTDYHNDLIKHDREWIEANPTTPFIHYSGNTGTHFIGFPTADAYPMAGERVKHLFGYADREHLLNEVVELAQYFNRERYYAKRVYFFDGKSLKKIDHGKAIELATRYTERIKREWRHVSVYA